MLSIIIILFLSLSFSLRPLAGIFHWLLSFSLDENHRNSVDQKSPLCYTQTEQCIVAFWRNEQRSLAVEIEEVSVAKLSILFREPMSD